MNWLLHYYSQMKRLGTLLGLLFWLGCAQKEGLDDSKPYMNKISVEYEFQHVEDIRLEETDTLFIGRLRTFAVGRNGYLYIGDGIDQVVKVFSPEGKFVRTIGKRGKGPGEITVLRGHCVDDDGNVYTSDDRLHRVSRFDSLGTFLGSFSIGEEYLYASGRLTYYQGGLLIELLRGYTSPKEMRNVKSIVTSFDLEGNARQSYGRFGRVYEDFVLPSFHTYVTVDSASNVYILTDHTPVVQKYSPVGTLLRLFYYPTTAYRPTKASYPMEGGRTAIDQWILLSTFGGTIANVGPFIICSFRNFTDRFLITDNRSEDVEHFLQIFDLEGNCLVEYEKAPGEFLGADRAGILYFNTKDEPGNRIISKWNFAVKAR